MAKQIVAVYCREDVHIPGKSDLRRFFLAKDGHEFKADAAGVAVWHREEPNAETYIPWANVLDLRRAEVLK